MSDDILIIGSDEDGLIIEGSKGGEKSKPRTPVEAPDSLRSTAYARILDLIGEGEIEGLVNGLASIYLDETSLYGPNGLNFAGVKVHERKGTQDQTYIQGFPAVENEIGVGVELRSSNAWERAITNVQLSAVRIRLSVPRLLKQNPENGDTGGHTIKYAIQLSVGTGPFNTVLMSAFSGKTTTKYERSHRIDLPASSNGWTVRVVRTTGNTTTGLISDLTFVEAITEIIDAKFKYPNSALIGLEFDSSQFSAIPPRAYHIRGRRIRVPSNYNPETRAYTGIWDGLFKIAYTNNPAWIYYDICSNDRYGLGHMINRSQIDKWELYRIGQYCDGSVSNGKGGTEPRFTCNLYLQTQAEALQVLQDICSVFRGMAYWGAGVVNVVADMPEDPVYLYTNANVVDGKFRYAGTSRKSRYSVALVSWNDPQDFYRAKVEYVEDREALARFGHRETKITAFGCTSQGQAQRLGKWILLTNRLEAETIDFTVGLDGTLVRPGSIITVADNKRAGRRIGGRLRNASYSTLVLDAGVEINAGDKITVITPSGVPATRVIGDISEATTWDRTTVSWDNTEITFDEAQLMVEVTLATPLTELPVPQSLWVVTSTTLSPQTFKILSIKEDFSGDKAQFLVTATRHYVGKHMAIDQGVRIDPPPITSIPPVVQVAPAEVRLSSDYSVSQGLSYTTMRIEWDKAPNAIAYLVQWRMNERDWIIAGRTGTTSFEVPGILAGTYVARVQAFSALDVGSPWTSSVETALAATTELPAKITDFTATSEIFGISLAWAFPNTLSSQTLQKTEIMYSADNVFANAIKLGDYAFPQRTHNLMGLSAGVQFQFWARLVDKFGNAGPWSDILVGTTSVDSTAILEYIAGQISRDELGGSLLAEIDFISGTGPGSVNGRIDVVRNNLTSQIQSLESQMAELTGAPDYVSTQAYAINSLVKYQGAIYQAKSAVPAGNLPTNATYWKKVGDYASIGEMVTALAAQVDTLKTQVTTLDGKLTAEITRVNTLITKVDANASAITAEATARANADSAFAEQLNTLTAKTNANVAAISNESSTRSDQIGALSLQVNTVAATANGAKTDAQNAATAAAKAAQDAAAAAAGAESVLIQSAAPPAAKQLPTVLWIDTTSNNNTPKRWNGSAWVAVTDKRAIDAAAAAANALSAAQAADTKAGQASASAQSASTAVATLDGKVSASSSIKTAVTAGGRTYIAGIGVGVSNTSGIIESQVLVSASRFAVVDPNTAVVTSPFAIVGGQTFIQNAVIQNAAIDTLKIQGNAVTIPVSVSAANEIYFDEMYPRPYAWIQAIAGVIDSQGAPIDIDLMMHYKLFTSGRTWMDIRVVIAGVVHLEILECLNQQSEYVGNTRVDKESNGIMPITFTGPAAWGARWVEIHIRPQAGSTFAIGRFTSKYRHMTLKGVRR